MGVKLRLFHLSDTHGFIPVLRGRADLVVHSGDLFPNRHNDADMFKPGTKFGTPDREVAFQAEWSDKNAVAIKEMLGGRPMLFTPGNHDYYDPTDRFRAEGIDFTNLGVKKLWHIDGIPFFGFPFCPYDVRPWNYATDVRDMQREIERMKMILKDEKDVMLVAHCPPSGVLDKGRSGTRYGNTSLANYLSFEALNVKAVLCGHIHEDHGITIDGGLLVSNAATVVHNLEFEFPND